MTTRMLRMNSMDCAWVGGVISCFGVLTHTHHVMPLARLQIKSSKHPAMVAKIAHLTGLKVRHKKTGDEIDLIGETLDMFYRMINPYLTTERVDEFKVMFAEVDHIRQEYQDKKKYEAERASDPHSTPDSIRHRAEALYHNQDPAVQVVDGFVEAEMATDYDLEQARIQREKAEAQMTKGMIKRGKK